jgi:hypothetical protein
VKEKHSVSASDSGALFVFMKTSDAQSATLASTLKECRQTVIDHLPAITQAMIDQAKDGSCQHAKFLFDLVNAIPAKATDDDDDDIPGPSLAEILLERLAALEEEEDSGTLPENAAMA